MTLLDLTPPATGTDEDVVAPGWVCDNCTAENARVRKRCEDCGTTRD
ncbi:hypothetical protein [Modestobacter sp. NPDC049651]